MSTGMRTRSQVPQEERDKETKIKEQQKLEKINRPLLTYHGKVVYVTEFMECAIACDELFELANKSTQDLVVGFDLEWPFSWKTGPGKTALMQISPTLEKCYLLHFTNMKSLPKGLLEFLHHPRVKITGVNIRNDVHKLCRDFQGFNKDKLLESCIDSRNIAKIVLPIGGSWGMERLVNEVLKKNINKDKKVRMSKWHIVPLTKDQQVYAACDGYASLLVYLELKKMQEEMIEKEQNQNAENVCMET